MSFASQDKSVVNDLMKTLEDGREGFAKAANLVEQTSPDACAMFRRLSQQRSSFYDELQEVAKDFEDSPETSGTIAAALHRGWMSIKDSVSGSDAEGVLDAAVQGEEHAVKAYETALESDNVSPGLRLLLDRQMSDVSRALMEVKAFRNEYQSTTA